VKDGAPCEAGKGTCCGGKCIPADTLCGGLCGNICTAPTPNCCGETCRECCTAAHCSNPDAPVCLDFQCVTEHVAETFERVRAIVAELLGIDDPDSITMDSAFIDDLHADSLDAVEIILALEEEFDLTISDEDAEKIRTVGDAVQYIVAHGG
jgi:acyl carrier protein